MNASWTWGSITLQLTSRWIQQAKFRIVDREFIWSNINVVVNSVDDRAHA